MYVLNSSEENRVLWVQIDATLIFKCGMLGQERKMVSGYYVEYLQVSQPLRAIQEEDSPWKRVSLSMHQTQEFQLSCNLGRC